jgi:hypothetical protein
LTNNSAGSYVLTTNLNLSNSGNSILGAVDVPVATVGAAATMTTTGDPGPSASVEDGAHAIGLKATAAQLLAGAMAGFGAASASVNAIMQGPSPLMSFLTRPYA